MTKIILHCPVVDTSMLPDLVEGWIAGEIRLIAVSGVGSEAIHDLIDELIVAFGNDEDRFIVTTWHDDEPIEVVVAFAENFGESGLIKHIKL